MSRQTRYQQQAEDTLWVWLLIGVLVATIGVILAYRRRVAIMDSVDKSIYHRSRPQPITAFDPPSLDSLISELEAEDKDEPDTEITPDDLTQIKGIGPKIAQALDKEGIITFQQLANTNVETLQGLMAQRKWQMVNCAAWVEQAQEIVGS